MAFDRLVTGRSFGVFSFVFNKTSHPRVGVGRKGEFPQALPPYPGLRYKALPSKVQLVWDCDLTAISVESPWEESCKSFKPWDRYGGGWGGTRGGTNREDPPGCSWGVQAAYAGSLRSDGIVCGA